MPFRFITIELIFFDLAQIEGIRKLFLKCLPSFFYPQKLIFTYSTALLAPIIILWNKAQVVYNNIASDKPEWLQPL